MGVSLVTQLVSAALVLVLRLSRSLAGVLRTRELREQPFSWTDCKSCPAQKQTPEGVSSVPESGAHVHSQFGPWNEQQREGGSAFVRMAA